MQPAHGRETHHEHKLVAPQERRGEALYQMATYLVTGAAGFIASKVCELLLIDGHTVVGVDNLNDYYDVRLKDWRLAQLLGEDILSLGSDPGRSRYVGSAGLKAMNFTPFEFHNLDIENRPALEQIFAAHRFDAVFNLAARAGVRYSLVNPHVYLSTNTQGTLNLLECQRKHGVKKHVLASTSSLYAGSAMPFTEEQSVNEPLSPYAASKKAAEAMAYSYHHLYGLDVTVLRYFTVFGPAGRPDMATFRFIKWIDEGRPIDLFGDGTQARDFTYVDDIARGTVLAAKPVGYEVINLGGGRNPISLQMLIGWVEQELGKKAVINGHPFHAADFKVSWADITKAEQCLRWVPIVGVEEGIRRTIAWYQANREWLKGIAL